MTPRLFTSPFSQWGKKRINRIFSFILLLLFSISLSPLSTRYNSLITTHLIVKKKPGGERGVGRGKKGVDAETGLKKRGMPLGIRGVGIVSDVTWPLPPIDMVFSPLTYKISFQKSLGMMIIFFFTGDFFFFFLNVLTLTKKGIMLTGSRKKNVFKGKE